jgi:predicted metal-dependent phosphoesterase TrpH
MIVNGFSCSGPALPSPDPKRPLSGCVIIFRLVSQNYRFVSIIDLHSHSRVSDGLLSPGDVARRAAANGVDMLALTDHDETGGLLQAREVAESLGLRFVDGVEISIGWCGLQVHIVGLAFDTQNAALAAGLESIRSDRIERAKRMAAELERFGIPGSFDGAMRHAQNPALIGRSHFARYLVEIGVSRDVRSVFGTHLVPGKPGYVTHRWITLKEALDWIFGAGGVAVLAHPGRYKFSRQELHELLDNFKAMGGQAIEVASGSHSPEQTADFARLAREYDFLASCGSDFHGPGESHIDIGRHAPLPGDLVPVWSIWD